MEKLIIRLKQHTPLIHFQPLQYEANLRASEVKPKFDKFIISKGFTLKKEWTHGKEPYSLNYKMKIYPVLDNNDKKIIDKLPMFFGNKTGIAKIDKKQGVCYSKGIYIEFITREKEIMTLIMEHIIAFLFYTNFGNRQSKGYGSYYIDSDKKENDSKVFRDIQIKAKDFLNNISGNISYREVNILIDKNNSKDTSVLEVYNEDILCRNYNIGLKKSIVINSDLRISPLPNSKTWKAYNNDELNKAIKNYKINRAPSPILLKIIDSNLYIIKRKDIVEAYNRNSHLNSNKEK